MCEFMWLWVLQVQLTALMLGQNHSAMYVLGGWGCDHVHYYHHRDKYDLRVYVHLSCCRNYFVRSFDGRVPWTKKDGNFSANSFIASSMAMASPT